MLVDIAHGRENGYVIFYESSHRTQYLAMPTADISGIEDPVLLRPNMPNFFALAWAEREHVLRSANRPLAREDIGLAINSMWSRSQSQLHIHIDCLKAGVRDLLNTYRLRIGAQWSEFPAPLAGHRYRALRLSEDELRVLDPFKRLAGSLNDPQHQMGAHTLVLVGQNFPEGPGFLLLDDQVNFWRLDLAGGESLQDHDCKLGRTS